MTYAYGMKNAPAVGQGLPGLPRREAGGAAGGSVSYPNGFHPLKIFREAPILSRTDVVDISVSTGSVQSVSLTEGIVDERRVLFDLWVTSDNSVHEFMIVGFIPNAANSNLSYQQFASVLNDYGIRDISLASGGTAFTFWVDDGGSDIHRLSVIEFDVDVVSDQTISFTSFSDGADYALAESIKDPSRSYCAITEQFSSDANGYHAPVYAIEEFGIARPVVPLPRLGRDFLVFPDKENVRYLGGGTSTDYKLTIREYDW